MTCTGVPVHIQYVRARLRTNTRVLSEHLKVWYIAQVLLKCPGTSLDTSTLTNFYGQLGVEPKTFRFPPVRHSLSYRCPHHHRPLSL